MATERAQRHSLTTRIAHWAITVSFALLFGTGAAIYDRRPRFRIGAHTLTLPRVPPWLTITASPKIVHYVFAGIFVLCGIVYVVWAVRNGHFKFAQYKPLQKATYIAVLFVITPLVVVTGAVMLPFGFLHPIERLFNGVGGVKLWHVTLISTLCLFVIGHVAMVIATGFVKNVSAMITGDYVEGTARLVVDADRHDQPYVAYLTGTAK